jgi:hypothetical protein
MRADEFHCGWTSFNYFDAPLQPMLRRSWSASTGPKKIGRGRFQKLNSVIRKMQEWCQEIAKDAVMLRGARVRRNEVASLATVRLDARRAKLPG